MLSFVKINYHRRHLYSIILALLIASIVEHYYAITHCFLMPLTTLYVMQTPIGTSFYQGMRRLALILFIAGFAALIITSMDFFYNLVHDIVIGTVIGITANLIILPRHPDVAFRKEIIPIIQSYNNYLLVTINQLTLQTSTSTSNEKIEYHLLKLPDWVYASGFNSILQTGYQFFLTQLTNISDVLFSLHHFSRHQYDKNLILRIQLPLTQYANSVSQFFSSIIAILELKKMTPEVSDLYNEIHEIEKQFYTIAPSNLELLEMQQDYLYLAAFIHCLKDLRYLLLKLADALT
ncbi:MAG: hypothetical protein ACD_45C00001G0003 [uncultured bacterium]|nr:MAG: hypothetical protein ACD_45C00001G0003 [uncultured bacterium]